MTTHSTLRTTCGARAAAGLALLAIFTAGALRAQTAENLRLTLGKSIVVDYPEDVRQLSTTNPDVADVTVVTTREILVHAKGLGSTDIVVWSANNQRTFYNVAVELNLDSLRRVLRETFPNDTIDVRTAGDSISLNGKVSSKEVADRAGALAAVAAKTVVSNLQIPGAGIDDQIQLRVRFAELDRQKIQEYGINFFTNGAFNTRGGIGTFQFGSGTLQVASIFTDLNVEIQLRALQANNVLQILAEPNLVTSSGKEASFLVGGEFPIPILQSSTANSITIQFKEYGIRLRFTPVVTANGTIKMALTQEVSSIDVTNSVPIAGFFVLPDPDPHRERRLALGREAAVQLGEHGLHLERGLTQQDDLAVCVSEPPRQLVRADGHARLPDAHLAPSGSQGADGVQWPKESRCSISATTFAWRFGV